MRSLFVATTVLIIVSGCTSPLRRSVELRRAGQLEEAYALLRGVYQENPKNRKIAQALEDVKSDLAHESLVASRECDAHDLPRRRLLLSRANSFYPTLDDLSAETEKVEMLFASVRAQSSDAKEAPDAVTALQGFAELRSYEPFVKSVQELSEYVATHQDSLASELRLLANQGDMNRAVSLAAACSNFFPKADTCSRTLHEFLGEYGRHALRSAQQDAAAPDQRCIATALAYSLFARNYAPEDPQIAGLVNDVRERFIRTLESNLFVLPSEAFSGKHHEMIGTAFDTATSSKRVTFIHDASPDHELTENDSVVVLGLEDISVETIRTEAIKYSKYLAGYRSVSNPTYSQLIVTYNQYIQMARNYAAQIADNPFMAIPQGIAQGKANAVVNSLRATPQFLQEPIHENYSYMEFEHRFPVVFALEYRIYSPTRGAPWKKGRLEYRDTFTKTSIVGAHPEDVRGIDNRNVAASAASEILRKFTCDGFARAASEICSFVSERPLIEAAAAFDRGDRAAARERLLGYAFSQADSNSRVNANDTLASPAEWLRESHVQSVADMCGRIDLADTGQQDFRISTMFRDTMIPALAAAGLDWDLAALISSDSCVETIRPTQEPAPFKTLGDVLEHAWPGESLTSTPFGKSVVGTCLESVVVVKTVHGSGSGFFVSHNGLIVTNYHVVGDDEDIVVKTSTGQRFFARVVATSKFRDLALIQVNCVDAKALPLGHIGPEWRGQVVYALGAPGGPEGKVLEQTVTKGIVSAVRRMPAPFNPNLEVEFVQTDAALNPGSSGGPLIDDRGNVVGVNTQKYVREDIEGLNFAISVREVYAAFPEQLP